MADNDPQNLTTEQDMNRNPTGKGGFQEHPENRNPGGWRKEVSFSYQYKRFMAMSIPELKKYQELPDEKRTVVEDLAFARVLAAKKSLMDVKEITDRTEGKPPQFIGLGSGDEYKKALVEFVGEDGTDDTTENPSKNTDSI